MPCSGYNLSSGSSGSTHDWYDSHVSVRNLTKESRLSMSLQENTLATINASLRTAVDALNWQTLKLESQMEIIQTMATAIAKILDKLSDLDLKMTTHNQACTGLIEKWSNMPAILAQLIEVHKPPTDFRLYPKSSLAPQTAPILQNAVLGSQTDKGDETGKEESGLVVRDPQTAQASLVLGALGTNNNNGINTHHLSPRLSRKAKKKLRKFNKSLRTNRPNTMIARPTNRVGSPLQDHGLFNITNTISPYPIFKPKKSTAPAAGGSSQPQAAPVTAVIKERDLAVINTLSTPVLPRQVTRDPGDAREDPMVKALPDRKSVV